MSMQYYQTNYSILKYAFGGTLVIFVSSFHSFIESHYKRKMWKQCDVDIMGTCSLFKTTFFLNLTGPSDLTGSHENLSRTII